MLEEFGSKLGKALEVLQGELAGIRAGRASASLVENVLVESYGGKMPIKQLANITVPDARSLAIQPWDRGNLAPIEKALAQSDLGLNPVNDGAMVRLNIPPLSAERRDELIKLAAARAEVARVAVRNVRHEAMADTLRQLKDKLISEDESKRLQKQVQEQVERVNSQIDQLLQTKETEIRTI